MTSETFLEEIIGNQFTSSFPCYAPRSEYCITGIQSAYM